MGIDPDTKNLPMASVVRTSISEDLSSMMELLWRKFPVFLFGFLPVVILSFFMINKLPTRYAAESSILINVRSQALIDLETPTQNIPLNNAIIETEVGVIGSRTLTESVVDKLNLIDVPEFGDTVKESEASSLKRLLTFQRKEPPVAVPEGQSKRDKVIENVQSRLLVKRDGISHIIAIRFEAKEPELTAKIANAYAELYLEQGLETKFENTRRTYNWLQDRLSTLKVEVQQAEENAAKFRAENGLLDNTSVGEARQIQFANSELRTARSELADYKSRYESFAALLHNGESMESITEVLSSPSVRSLKASLVQAQNRGAELRAKLGAEHPDIIKVDQEIATVRGEINLEMQRIFENLKNEIKIKEMVVDSKRREVIFAENNVAQNNTKIIRLRELEREAESLQALYSAFLKRFQQLSDVDDLNLADAKIISNAPVPLKPSFPNHMQLGVTVLAIAGAIGLTLVFIANAFETGVRTEGQLEERYQIRSLGAVPLYKPRRGNAFLPFFSGRQDLSHIAEVFFSLSYSLEPTANNNDFRSILMTSFQDGDGVTFNSMAYAEALAISGKRVVVVDTQILDRGLTNSLKIHKKSEGLLQVLDGSAPLIEAVHETESGVNIVPFPKGDVSRFSVFDHTKIQRLLQELEREYDVVIFDSPSVLAVRDILGVARVVDDIILNVSHMKTSHKKIKSGLRIFKSNKINVSGFILNKVP